MIVYDLLHTLSVEGNIVLTQFTYIPTDNERTYLIGEED